MRMAARAGAGHGQCPSPRRRSSRRHRHLEPTSPWSAPVCTIAAGHTGVLSGQGRPFRLATLLDTVAAGPPLRSRCSR